MRNALLIFLSSMLILFIGLFFGYKQLKNPYKISASIETLAQPFSSNLDKEFIKEKSF